MTARRALFWVHLTLGVAAAGVVLVLSATGLLLVVQRPATSWAEREVRRLAAPRTEPFSIERVLAGAQAGPLPGAPTQVTVFADRAEAPLLALGRESVVYLDPASGRVIGPGSARARGFFHAVEDWHRWLAAPGESRPTGRALTGAATLAFVVLTLTGPALWWPRRWVRAHLRPAFLFQRGLSGRARDFNWHNVLGIWSVAPLFLIALTGVVMAYPWANDLLFRVSGDVPPPRREGPPAGGGREDRKAPPSSLEGLDALWTRASAHVAGWRTISLRLPVPAQGPVTFTVDRGNGSRPDLRAQLTLDRRSGAVVRFEPYAVLTPGRRWRAWARWTHTGEAGGPLGMAVAGLACGGAVVLGVTGLTLAWRRGRAWAGRRAAAAEEPTPSDAPAPAGESV